MSTSDRRPNEEESTPSGAQSRHGECNSHSAMAARFPRSAITAKQVEYCDMESAPGDPRLQHIIRSTSASLIEYYYGKRSNFEKTMPRTEQLVEFFSAVCQPSSVYGTSSSQLGMIDEATQEETTELIPKELAATMHIMDMRVRQAFCAF